MYFYDIERKYSILPEKVVLKKIKSFKNQYPNPLNIIVRGKNDQSNVLFNVLPKKNIKEQVIIKKYLLKKRFIEAIFDRKYYSDMIDSPDHLIFLSSLIQLQKMIYVYLCYELEIDIKLHEEEKLKIWPTNIKIDMPKMITKKNNLSQKIKIMSLRKVSENSYYGKCVSEIENIVFISADAMISII